MANNPQSNKAPRGKPGPELRLLAWEVTRTCNLSCVHCRAAAVDKPYADELTHEECLQLLDDVSGFAKPIVILTGGEPLMRADLFEIAAYGTEKGLRMVLATNGTLLDSSVTARLQQAGIRRVSISIDGATAASHDRFRQVPGAFQGAMDGISFLREAGLEFQINTTITRVNLDELPAIQALALDLGAVAHHIFLLVPTGRGKDFKEQEIDAADYERTLNWFYDQRRKVPLQLKATCAPHYFRIMRQRARAEGQKVTVKTHGMDAVTRGCLGGTGFLFLSHVGQVQPCGYLELDCGNVRQASLGEIWRNSPILQKLRDVDSYKGKCGVCEYRRVCGGCRARAYEATGDYLAAEPLCTYEPQRVTKEPSAPLDSRASHR
ncbi:MAG: heme b synthase [Deltaproteobacteria bacterium]|nr:heme b synthase [Deltaproteobacteria bacterium]MBW2071596.1 heme b synthase [Deltaproteobacteria bacterium]